MGVVIELTSRSNSSRRCVRDLSHQANHGYFGQLGISTFTVKYLDLASFCLLERSTKMFVRHVS